jgi:hypothetical protein
MRLLSPPQRLVGNPCGKGLRALVELRALWVAPIGRLARDRSGGGRK